VCRNVASKDGRWKELTEGCLVKFLILAVMNLSATRHLVKWSLKQKDINENIRRKPVCYGTEPPQTSVLWYRASSNQCVMVQSLLKPVCYEYRAS
jgi:hypothetical protein